METLSLIFYPLTVTLIDDDALILKVLTDYLKQYYKLITFTNPIGALSYLKNHDPLLPSLKFLRGCKEFENYDVSGHLPVDLNLSTLTELSKQTKRVDEIGVIIVDYNMPDINGIEFCRQLKSLPIKKILLTGETNDQLAISAFNEGIIDCFIRKDSPCLPSDIQFHLNILTQRYFENSTKQLLKHLETDNSLHISDPTFIIFFKDWCSSHNIREYYLSDQNGNFLLIDEHNVKFNFIVHTERTLNYFIEIHKDNNETLEFISAVKLRKKIPFFNPGKESWILETTEWINHFHTPQILQGREKYYWTVI